MNESYNRNLIPRSAQEHDEEWEIHLVPPPINVTII